MAKILVVDDNEKNISLARAVLVFHDHEVFEATSGEEGVRKAREEKPDVILMDIQMPAMDGITAMKIIKADPATRAIKIICVTAYAEGDRGLVLEVGFDDYISKPIDTRALPGIVQKHLR